MEIKQEKIIEVIKQLETIKGLQDFYFKQYQENSSKTAKTFYEQYQGQETGIAKVLDILGINY